MKKIFLMAIIMLIASSHSVAQVRAAQYQSQFDENYYNRQLEIIKARNAAFENSRKYANSLIDWIFELKKQTDDEDFIYAMNVYYKKLRSFEGKDYESLSGAIRRVEIGIKEEIDNYNTRLKKAEAQRNAKTAEENSPNKYWDIGNNYYNNSEFASAINNYNKVIQLNPTFPSVYLYRGNSYDQLGNLSQALDDYSKFIQLAPNESVGYRYRGWAKYKQNDYIGSIKDFNKQIELTPKSSEGYYNRGSAKSALKDYYGAIKDYEKAIEINPNFSMAYNNIAWAKFEQKKYSKALIDVNKAIELDNNNYVAFDSRAEIKFNLKDYKGCIADADIALQLNPKMANAYFLKGRSSYRLGNKQKACEYWSKAGELGKNEAYKYISKYCNN